MSKFKGTKGKWFACCDTKRPHFLFTENGDITICAFIQKQEMSDDLSDEVFRANAKLIAAAPELLESLIVIINMGSTGEDAVEMKREAIEAIKKATE